MLVMLAICALIMGIVFGAASRGVRDNFGLADRALDSAERARAETEFRRLLHAGHPTASLAGSVDTLNLALTYVESRGCGGGKTVRLRLVHKAGGGALHCDRNGRDVPILAWRRGEARFAYSEDGRLWHDRWPPAACGQARPILPLVRLTLLRAGHVDHVWIEQAGSGQSVANPGLL
ncbi:hypothetical protein CLG96_08215 [Sphingomonas oleivorans]|uniref:Prepilin-type cleavage/methylation domain-containing protein n=2 Tax=Sphingomonas oleivorans TaxID=1735121 RepID=A0A2T5FY17_9SPHN|nr:hypothetical protein CLG96_08215 [Sphingomonas oleivorans]